MLTPLLLVCLMRPQNCILLWVESAERGWAGRSGHIHQRVEDTSSPVSTGTIGTTGAKKARLTKQIVAAISPTRDLVRLGTTGRDVGQPRRYRGLTGGLPGAWHVDARAAFEAQLLVIPAQARPQPPG